MADTDLAELRKQCITSLYLCTDNVSRYLDNEKEAEFNKLKSYVQEYCTLEARQDVAMQALEKAKKETNSANADTLDERFSSHLQSMAGKRLNVNKHPYMLEITKRIGVIKNSAKENLDESDLAITETQEQYLDPITKRPIVDPVRNKQCSHIYESDIIMQMISVNQKTKCPVAGCGNRKPITKDDLFCDEELKFRMTLTQHSTVLNDRSTMQLDDTM